MGGPAQTGRSDGLRLHRHGPLCSAAGAGRPFLCGQGQRREQRPELCAVGTESGLYVADQVPPGAPAQDGDQADGPRYGPRGAGQ